MTSKGIFQRPGVMLSYATILLFLAVGLTGCSSCRGKGKSPGQDDSDIITSQPTGQNGGATSTLPGDTTDPGGGEGDPRELVNPDARRGSTVPVPELKTVYFAYDKSELRPEAIDTLNENLEWLQNNPEAIIQIEGHCDERGTREYNFNLGQRRAQSVIKYLVQKGVDLARLNAISFGEDRPAVIGTGEEVWSQNRRVEFKRFVD